jgi:hypothetical protein
MVFDLHLLAFALRDVTPGVGAARDRKDLFRAQKIIRVEHAGESPTPILA